MSDILAIKHIIEQIKEKLKATDEDFEGVMGTFDPTTRFLSFTLPLRKHMKNLHCFVNIDTMCSCPDCLKIEIRDMQ